MCIVAWQMMPRFLRTSTRNCCLAKVLNSTMNCDILQNKTSPMSASSRPAIGCASFARFASTLARQRSSLTILPKVLSPFRIHLRLRLRLRPPRLRRRPPLRRHRRRQRPKSRRNDRRFLLNNKPHQYVIHSESDFDALLSTSRRRRAAARQTRPPASSFATK
jgi:hypothetical protein